eukprot:g81989.t1
MGGYGSGRSRPVVCKETGEVFGSIKEAAISVGRSMSSIHNALSLSTKCAGFTWSYLEPLPPREQAEAAPAQPEDASA